MLQSLNVDLNQLHLKYLGLPSSHNPKGMYRSFYCFRIIRKLAFSFYPFNLRIQTISTICVDRLYIILTVWGIQYYHICQMICSCPLYVWPFVLLSPYSLNRQSFSGKCEVLDSNLITSLFIRVFCPFFHPI
jgi:hypothetical protein